MDQETLKQVYQRCNGEAEAYAVRNLKCCQKWVKGCMYNTNPLIIFLLNFIAMCSEEFQRRQVQKGRNWTDRMRQKIFAQPQASLKIWKLWAENMNPCFSFKYIYIYSICWVVLCWKSLNRRIRSYLSTKDCW